MFYKKTITAALVLTLGALQFSQAQAGNRYPGGYYGSHQKPALVACKRAMSVSGSASTQQRGKRIVKKRWQVVAYARYHQPYRWHAARNQQLSCRLNTSTGKYKCRAKANPCRAGAGQYVQ